MLQLSVTQTQLHAQIYFPQFASMGAGVANVTAQQAPNFYSEAGQMLFAIASSQRLQNLYVSLGHGLGCACSSCSVAAAGQVQGAFGPASGAVSAAARIEDDPHGVSQSGQGTKSNLANSPEVTLALSAVLKEGGSKTLEEVQKELQDKFGIQCEIGEVGDKSKKGLKFGNGDYFIDGNGNGQLDSGDYKFDAAIKDIKDKYHLKDEDLSAITDRMKGGSAKPAPSLGGGGYAGYPAYGGSFGGFGGVSGSVVPLADNFVAPTGLLAELMEVGPPNLVPEQGWMTLFYQAWQIAGVA